MEGRAQDNKIRFKINGLERDQGRVRLSVYKEKLDQLGKILSDAERQAAHVRKARSNYLVSDLKYSSAYTEILPFEEGGYAGSVAAVGFLSDVLQGIDSEEAYLGDIESSIVEKIRTICNGDKQQFDSQTILIGDRQFVFDDKLAAKAQKYLDKKYFSHGEVKGKIERVNIHDRSDFYLYPEFWSGTVTCHFNEDDLLEKVRTALGKVVIISGLLEFIGTDVNPVAAKVSSVEIQPENYQPPSIDEFFGVAPNISGDMDVVDFVKGLRSNWDRH